MTNNLQNGEIESTREEREARHRRIKKIAKEKRPVDDLIADFRSREQPQRRWRLPRLRLPSFGWLRHGVVWKPLVAIALFLISIPTGTTQAVVAGLIIWGLVEIYRLVRGRIRAQQLRERMTSVISLGRRRGAPPQGAPPTPPAAPEGRGRVGMIVKAIGGAIGAMILIVLIAAWPPLLAILGGLLLLGWGKRRRGRGRRVLREGEEELPDEWIELPKATFRNGSIPPSLKYWLTFQALYNPRKGLINYSEGWGWWGPFNWPVIRLFFRRPTWEIDLTEEFDVDVPEETIHSFARWAVYEITSVGGEEDSIILSTARDLYSERLPGGRQRRGSRLRDRLKEDQDLREKKDLKEAITLEEEMREKIHLRRRRRRLPPSEPEEPLEPGVAGRTESGIWIGRT